MKIRAGLAVVAALALGALGGAGCATTRGSGDAGAAAAFVAPDGARATPNTGASRLADGLGAGDGPAAPSVTATGGAAAPAAAGAPRATGEGVVFTWAGGGSTVNLAGEFNSWSADADPLTKQADGTFRIVKKLEPGRYAYKFVVDGQWQPDPRATESVDDGFGGKNSVVVVGAGAPGATAPPATPAAPAAGAATVAGRGRAPEFTPDGIRFTYAGAAKYVHLAGDFNEWSLTGDPLIRGSDGTWTIVKKLPSGSHAYKFVVDGTTWKTDEANAAQADDGFGGKNSIVTVP